MDGLAGRAAQWKYYTYPISRLMPIYDTLESETEGPQVNGTSGSQTNEPTKRNFILILEDLGTTHPSFSSCGGLGSPLYPFGGLGHTCIHVYMHICIHGYIDTCIHA